MASLRAAPLQTRKKQLGHQRASESVQPISKSAHVTAMHWRVISNTPAACLEIKYEIIWKFTESYYWPPGHF